MKFFNANNKALSLFLILLAIAGATSMTACGKQGDGEKAGEKIDEAVDETQDAMEGDGPAEEAGEDLDDKLD